MDEDDLRAEVERLRINLNILATFTGFVAAHLAFQTGKDAQQILDILITSFDGATGSVVGEAETIMTDVREGIDRMMAMSRNAYGRDEEPGPPAPPQSAR